MKKYVPKILLLVVLVTLLLYVFADTSFDYYKQKSEDTFKALIFTQNDNLYHALDVLNDLDGGAILVVDTSNDKVHIIKKGVGDWDFQVRRENGSNSSLRETFRVLDCTGLGAEYQVPNTKRSPGSIIKISNINAECYTPLGSNLSFDSTIDDLKRVASNVRNVYKLLPAYINLPDDAITLAEANPVIAGELKLTPSIFNKATTKKIDFEFTVPEDFDEGYLLYIVTESIDKTEAEIIEMINSGDLVGKLVPIFVSAEAVYAKNAVLKGSIAEQDRLELIQDLDKGKYFVYVHKVVVGPGDKALVGAFLAITGEKTQTPCDKCETLVHCLACINQTFVEDILG